MEDERELEGSIVSMKRGNARPREGTLLFAMAQTKREARVI